MLRNYQDINGLNPAHSPELAVKRPVSLPVGSSFAKGTLLGLVTYAAATSEIRTLTITGSPTGFTGTVTFTSGAGAHMATLANAVDAIPTAAQMQTAFESIFGVGNVTVSKSSLVYTITFAGVLANVRIASNFTSSFTYTAGTNPAAAFAISTRGTAGVGQYDVYSDAASDGTQTAKAALIWPYYSDQYGGRVASGMSTGQPFAPAAYHGGYFFCTDLVGLDANAVTDLGKLVEGTSISADGAVLRIT